MIDPIELGLVVAVESKLTKLGVCPACLQSYGKPDAVRLVFHFKECPRDPTLAIKVSAALRGEVWRYWTWVDLDDLL